MLPVNMTIICNIRAMERQIETLQPHTFEQLWAMPYHDLRALQDQLVPQYNQAVEARRFAAEMIYKR